MTIAEFFGRDHDEIDGLFSAFRVATARGEDGSPHFATGTERLRRHMFWEEEILFPEVEARGVSGPTYVMRMEHGQVSTLLDRIGDMLSRGEGPREVLETFDRLKELLGDHNLKEESILYPLADEVAEEASRRRLLDRVRREIPPQGWKCAALR